MNDKKVRERIITVILTFAVVTLAVICILIYMFSDRKAPIITVDEEYLETCDLNREADILKAVTAVDDKSENVEKLLGDIIDFGDGTFKIYFVAKDGSGNTSTASVVVENDTVMENNVVIEETDSAGADETGREDNGGLNADAIAEGRESVPEIAETFSPESPAIKLKTNETEIMLGTEFRYLSYVESISDDKDDSYDLYKRINLVGDYDFTSAGQYTIYYYVTDLDGNKSNVESLTVVVREE